MTDLDCRRGDTWKHQATLGPSDSTIVGSLLWFTVKKNERDADAAAIVRLRSDGVSPGIVIDDATHATVTIAAAKTALLPPGTHWYDLQIRTPAGEVYTADSGAFVVSADITRATS
jgi:hypothetical protein